MYAHTTIAAVATPPGIGGVAIIRISGPKALACGAALFKARAQSPLGQGKMYFGDFTDEKGGFLDSGYFVWFRAPHSFTGEDVVEYHCHGGPIILRGLLKALLAGGAELADPGEFSKRAFLNGRIDLTQAESIADLISADSEQAAQIARAHYQGKLSSQVTAAMEGISGALAWIEAEIDYPEAEIDSAERGKARAKITKQLASLEKLQQTYVEGKIYRDGVATVILGSPNVGKSSLLNVLAGEERAIVTDIPGTTRDILEVPIVIRGIPLRLADTAGIRESTDTVERIGVERARKLAETADLVILVIDTSQPLTPQDLLLLQGMACDRVLVALNKTDLPPVTEAGEIQTLGFRHIVQISALQEQGIEALKDAIEDMFVSGDFSGGKTFVSNQRHYHALKTASALLAKVIAGWDALPLDILALDLRQAWQGLGEITGTVWTENLLDDIFAKFCLGK